MSSLSATSGSLYYAAYNAGKAFEWIFGETLWSELAEVGIDVNTMLAGADAVARIQQDDRAPGSGIRQGGGV